MSDLKEFLDKEQKSGIVNVNKLGLFFWERGGKQFVKSYLICDKKFVLEQILADADFYHDNYGKEGIEGFTGNNYNVKLISQSKDFLDCVACLGEDKVKELIEGLK